MFLLFLIVERSLPWDKALLKRLPWTRGAGPPEEVTSDAKKKDPETKTQEANRNS